MKSTILALLSSLAASSAYGPITYDSANNTYICAPGAYAYCAGNSGGTNIIMRCVNGIGQPGNCDDNLDEPPAYNAFCYDSAPGSPGNAVCAIQGTYQYENSTMTSYTVVTTSIPTAAATSSSYMNSTMTVTSGSGPGSVTTTVVAPDCSSLMTSSSSPGTVVPPPVSPVTSTSMGMSTAPATTSSTGPATTTTGILTGGAGKNGAGVGLAVVLAAAVMAL